MTAKERFIQIYKEKITRDGSDRLLGYLESSDFFTAPASTRFHGSYPGGLVEHSLNVYDCLCDNLSRPIFKEKYGLSFTEETLAVVALLHDLCKVNFYEDGRRNVKENGVWKEVPYYSVNDRLPYGHGEKSVYIASGYMRLSRDEAFAIRYHMGFSTKDEPNQVSAALEMFPLAYLLYVADMEATFLVEKKPN